MRLLAMLMLTAFTVLQATIPGHGREPVAPLLTGKVIYEQLCAGCHGMAGWGDGPEAHKQVARPANFHSHSSRMKSDEQLLSAITHGIVFSPTHAWGDALTPTQRDEIVTYIRLLTYQAR